MKPIKHLLLVCICMSVAACQSSSTYPGAAQLPKHIAKGIKKKVHIGKPYTIKGKTYYPKYQPNYDETGIASWYGPGFHGKKTANGETYNQYAMTAAHPTLPLPSLVRVTNLKNGQVVTVRINDRGPFARGRIIDLSRRAAEAIGIKGIQKVRVQYLKDETERFWASNNVEPKGLPGVAHKPSTAAYQPHEYVAPAPVEQAAPAPIMSVSSTQVADLDASQRPVSTWQTQEPEKQAAAIPPARRTEEVQLSASSWGSRRQAVDHSTRFQKPTNDGPDHIPDKRPDPPATRGGYAIQVGAFASQHNAAQLQQKISHIGQVFIDQLERASGTLYRVRIGPYPSYSDASNRLHEAFKLGIKDAAVVAIK